MIRENRQQVFAFFKATEFGGNRRSSLESGLGNPSQRAEADARNRAARDRGSTQTQGEQPGLGNSVLTKYDGVLAEHPGA
ncbi:MAG: hypothetical protein DMG30_12820 [Acidobacteria bacterium]|nr:MAG: hypothetical protein DMG30_12820 [Acidobacteriota bacterium]